jgi:hypothetical protein
VDQSRLFVRRVEGVEKAEASAAGAIDISQGCHDRIQPRLLRERHGRMEGAKVRSQHAIELDKEIRRLALHDEDCRPMLGLDFYFRVTSLGCL